jgi:hypothetical protein
LQVTAIFFVTFLMVIGKTSFPETHGLICRKTFCSGRYDLFVDFYDLYYTIESASVKVFSAFSR